HSGPDLLGPLQVTRGDSLLELLQALAGPLHRLFPFGLLIAAALVGVDDDDAQVRIAGADFLGPCPRRVGLPFPGIDAAGTGEPLRLINGVEPTVNLGVASPLDP